MNNENKHTPGPWIINKDANFVTIETMDGQDICAMPDVTKNMELDGEELANAKLISYAPEMLELLIKIHKGEHPLVAFELENLIKKVTE